MAELSESFYLSVAGIAAGLIALGFWYFKSVLITSRCSELWCCGIHIINQPVSETALEEIIEHEHPPTQNMFGQNR